ncbi:chaperone protein DnaJ [Methanolobus psychrophilus R15]|nr:chaperone protein DnaJ [Methanolobus psychrophilus R15]
MSVPDYYSVLGMPPGASQDELKKRYRTLIAKYHPDRNSDAGAEEQSKRINEAYSILADPEKRTRYDRSLHYPGYAASAFEGNSTYGNSDGNSTRSNFRSYSCGNYTYRSYTYRTHDAQGSAENVDFFGILLSSLLKVAAILLVLWLVLHFFVLFMFLLFLMMLLYLVWVVLGQILGFFFGRR